MKFTSKKFTVAIIATICSVFFANAQEIIKDSVKTKTPNTYRKQKVDGVIATVGDYIILGPHLTTV